MKSFTLRDSIVIHAPIKRCFLLSTSLKVVQQELRMKPVAGRTQGCVTAGDTVRWEGWQLGFWNYHVSLIVPETFAAPRFFQDRMLAGRFRSFEHDHTFAETAAGVELRDELRLTMPFGALGWLVGQVLLVPHIRRLLRRRFRLLKKLAEGDDWQQWIA